MATNNPAVAVLAFLGAQRVALAAHPQSAEYYAQFEDLFDRKLWHQLTVKLQEYIRTRSFKDGPELLALYQQFIQVFEMKLNMHSLADILLAVSQNMESPSAAVEFLKQKRTQVRDHVEASTILSIEVAQNYLVMNDLVQCRSELENAQKLLDAIAGVHPEIHSMFYRVSADLAKAAANYDDYYRNSLLYLSAVRLESLSDEQKFQRAHDTALAALLGSTTYNFGELLTHSIFGSLQGTDRQWLYELLRGFSVGDISVFVRLEGTVRGEPQLAGHIPFLQEKLRLMRLQEVVFRLGSKARQVPFALVAQETQLALDQVELLLMKGLALNLIKGTIDEVAQSIQITWVQPRVLDQQQLGEILTRIQDWRGRVTASAIKMENETPELFVQ